MTKLIDGVHRLKRRLLQQGLRVRQRLLRQLPPLHAHENQKHHQRDHHQHHHQRVQEVHLEIGEVLRHHEALQHAHLLLALLLNATHEGRQRYHGFRENRLVHHVLLLDEGERGHELGRDLCKLTQILVVQEPAHNRRSPRVRLTPLRLQVRAHLRGVSLGLDRNRLHRVHKGRIENGEGVECDVNHLVHLQVHHITCEDVVRHDELAQRRVRVVAFLEERHDVAHQRDLQRKVVHVGVECRVEA